MKKFFKQIDLVREKIKSGPANILLSQKPFADGMYRFSMFIISYYSRVREELKIDYDSFMIIQTTVSHSLYHLKKKENRSNSYEELQTEWERMLLKHENVFDLMGNYKQYKKNLKLTISSICLVTGLPKETARRKINELCKRNLLKISTREGILLGPMYKDVFQEFVPQTTLEVSKLIKHWEKTGILKDLLNFKI